MAAASIGQVHAAHLARRARGRGQGAVPGRRRRDPGRPRQHRAPRVVRRARQPSSRRSGSTARSAAPSPRRSPSASPRSSTTASRRPTRPSSPTHYRDHPFIRIPEVVPELSTERVLVMDEHDGLRWTAALEQPQELKDTWGEVIYRFVYGSLYDFGAFNADPHPGNYLFHDDGGVTFLDFGCVKRFSRDQIAVHAPRSVERGVRRRRRRRRARPVLRRTSHLIPRDTKLTPQRLSRLVRADLGARPGRTQPFTFTPEFAALVIERNFDPLGEWGDVVRGIRRRRGVEGLDVPHPDPARPLQRPRRACGRPGTGGRPRRDHVRRPAPDRARPPPRRPGRQPGSQVVSFTNYLVPWARAHRTSARSPRPRSPPGCASAPPAWPGGCARSPPAASPPASCRPWPPSTTTGRSPSASWPTTSGSPRPRSPRWSPSSRPTACSTAQVDPSGPAGEPGAHHQGRATRSIDENRRRRTAWLTTRIQRAHPGGAEPPGRRPRRARPPQRPGPRHDPAAPRQRARRSARCRSATSGCSSSARGSPRSATGSP